MPACAPGAQETEIGGLRVGSWSELYRETLAQDTRTKKRKVKKKISNRLIMTPRNQTRATIMAITAISMSSEGKKKINVVFTFLTVAVL